jgi:carbon storage regulator CsrA
MLVLSRRLNQTIVIAGHVRVTVLAITPKRVEIGVEAPAQIAVDRE